MQSATYKEAAKATLHCLTGCAIGEILGMVISAGFSLSNFTSVVLSVILAFVFGYGLSMKAILPHGLSLFSAFKVAAMADSVSVFVMEAADNVFILLVPGAISATLSSWLFWWSLMVSLVVAFFVALPVNKFLISRGKGHAYAHKFHSH